MKATVDAYDGRVTLYAWDESDPLLKAWQKVFPTTVKPLSQIDGPLMSHLRYPEDLFKVQRNLLQRYHVNDADAFFGGQDFWRVPSRPGEAGSGQLPAALLPDAADAHAGRAVLLADLDLHPGRPPGAQRC